MAAINSVPLCFSMPVTSILALYLRVSIGSPTSHLQISVVSSNLKNENHILSNPFIQLCLSKHDTSFILNGKEWRVARTEREKKGERQSVGEKGLRCGL